MERTGDMIVLKMPESIKKKSNKKKNRSGLKEKSFQTTPVLFIINLTADNISDISINTT